MRNIIFSVLLLLFGFQASAMAFTPAVDAEQAVQELSAQSYHQTGDVENLNSVDTFDTYAEWAVMGLPMVYEQSTFISYLGLATAPVNGKLRRHAPCAYCRQL